jgi:hypothetical protein
VGEPAASLPFPCHACTRSFRTWTELRVHAVVDERRVLTPAEKAGSAQLSLFLQPLTPPATTDRGAQP